MDRFVILYIALLGLFVQGCTPSENTIKVPDDLNFAYINGYSPVFTTPDIYGLLSNMEYNTKTDKKGLISEVAFIAQPGSTYKITGVIESNGFIFLKIKNSSSDKDYYIDSRFVEYVIDYKEQNKKPGREEIINNLIAMKGCPYEYGGSIANGVWKLQEMYSLNGLNEKWKPKGMDCSGIIYQATNGLTPRTSTEMTEFGEGLDIEGKDLDEILEMIEPLDIIGYPGHVFIAIDKNYIIESSPNKGVRMLLSKDRIKTLMRDRKPVNSTEEGSKDEIFVIRRWFKE